MASDDDAARCNSISLEVFRTLPETVQSGMRHAAAESDRLQKALAAAKQAESQQAENVQFAEQQLEAEHKQSLRLQAELETLQEALVACHPAAKGEARKWSLRSYYQRLGSGEVLAWSSSERIHVRSTPVWLAPPEGDVCAAFEQLLDAAGGDMENLSDLKMFRDLAGRDLPTPDGSRGAQAEAEAGTAVSQVRLMPPIHTELKSVSSSMFYRGVIAALKRMGSVCRARGSDLNLLFFREPPVGYVMMGFPHVAYLVSVEMVGEVFAAPASAPFLLGSEAHREAVSRVPSVANEPAVQLTNEGWRDSGGGTWCGRIFQRVHDGRFQKVIPLNGCTADDFVRMLQVFRRFETLPYASCPNGVVQKASMSFGWHQVLIEMPQYADASECTDEEVFDGGFVTERVAEGVAWLAMHRILYTDVRGPNAVKHGDAVRLVDFDDCVAVDAPITSAEQYRALLLKSHAAASHDGEPARTFAALCEEPWLEDFMASLQAAFERLPRDHEPAAASAASAN